MSQTRETTTSRTIQLRPVVTLLGWILAVFVIFHFIDAMKLLVLGVLASCALAAMLSPIASRMPGPRGLAAVAVGFGALIIVVGIISGIGVLLANPIKQEWQSWPQTKDQLNGQIQHWSDRLGVDQPPNVDQVVAQAVSWMGSGFHIVSGTASVLLDLLFSIGFVLIGAMYILAEPGGRLTEPALKILSVRHRRAMRGAIDDLEPKLRWWALGSLTGMLVVGIATGIGYKVVGLQIAIPLALFTGLLEIIPTVGPLTGFLIALVFATLQGKSQIAGVIVVYAIVQSLEAYVLLPLIMRRAVHIPPIVTLFSVVVWGKVFGVAGLLLAIPIDLVIWSLISHFMIEQSPRAAAD